MEALELDGEGLTCRALAEAAAAVRPEVRLGDSARARLVAARAVVTRALESGEAVYGLTTGLGARATERLSEAELSAFSLQTLRGRALSLGRPLPAAVVRAAMIVRLNGLGRGAAGCDPAVADFLVACLARGLTPLVRESGSIGASDLLLGATMGLALAGEGELVDAEGRVGPSTALLRAAGLAPLPLGPRDGLALANHSSFSGALAALLAARAATALAAVQRSAALSMEGFRANLSPLDPAALALRPQPGQDEAAAELRELLAGSGLEAPGAARRLQDPLSFRTLPQTHGAAHAALAAARAAAEAEINGASDNPAVLLEDDRVVSNGAFQTPWLTLAVETLNRALAQVAVLLVGRCAKLLAERFTGLPLFLARPGADSNGFAPVMKLAEALLGEVQQAAQPVAVWPSVNAEGVEDSLTNAPLAARCGLGLLDAFERLVAIEALVAAQAVELRGLAGALTPPMAAVLAAVRRRSPPLAEDRPLAAEIEALAGDLRAGAFGE
ncbi:histidine ammonia-lyase [Tistlia consotensis]|uniref:Histidine ammonia-lyase n=1 Tax=Tistlia consotensis USBA 355 TaxID=560819 RepID=A0A1Y6BB20_9PROT|nr:aromatic amino acid ammonia-lyase [Tistlia consotensis]SME94824.1 histidine ammonia-lyase [Tistlia consotensis USBA 355]SNR29574.1 histidine ammonia-lyase [Tistlia consotensis]